MSEFSNWTVVYVCESLRIQSFLRRVVSKPIERLSRGEIYPTAGPQVCTTMGSFTRAVVNPTLGPNCFSQLKPFHVAV